MIGLVIGLVRLLFGILRLSTRLLTLLIDYAVRAVGRRSSAPPAASGAASTAQPPQAAPSRRRAFTAPPRTRRTNS